jgi:hypothetical protein
MVGRRKLFLEERVGIARRALNEQALEFQGRLPVKYRERFRDYVLSLMATLDGDPEGPEALESLAARAGDKEEMR